MLGGNNCSQLMCAGFGWDAVSRVGAQLGDVAGLNKHSAPVLPATSNAFQSLQAEGKTFVDDDTVAICSSLIGHSTVT